MRWSLLLILLFVAVIEAQLPLNLGNNHIPLTFLLILVCFISGWLSTKESILFMAICGYLLDVIGAIYPGRVLISALIAISLFVFIYRKYNKTIIAITLGILMYLSLMTVINGLNSIEYFSITMITSIISIGVTYLALSLTKLLEGKI